MKSKFRQYVDLTQPNWKLVICQFITIFCNVALKALDVVFVAKITVSLYHGIATGDFSQAYLYLGLQVACVVIRNIFTWLNYLVYNPTFSGIFNRVQTKIIRKVMEAKDSNFAETSKEKIINIIGTNVETLASFTDTISIKCSYLVQVIVSISFVAQADLLVAMMLLLSCTVNFFILRYLNKKSAISKEKQFEAKDGIYEEADKIMSGKDIIKEFGIHEKYHEEYKMANMNYAKATKKKILIDGFKSSWFYVIYFIMTALLTAFMIYLVSDNQVTIELYLIVVPYFLTITELLNNFFEITSSVEDCHVALSRVNTILNFTSEEINKFGNVSDELGGTNISFVGVNYTNKNLNSPYLGTLTDVDISFSSKNLNIVLGKKRSGKRLIFNMLRRKINPDSGVITLDNQDIRDFSIKTFKNNIYYCVSNPIFIQGTIMENLGVSSRKKEEITQICQDLAIYDTIMALPKGFETPINERMTRALLFLIGMARALLTGCKTLMIYEIPNSLTDEDKKRILKAIYMISQKRTVIFFTHDASYVPLAKVVYRVENGKIIAIKINDTIDTSLLEN